MQQTRIHVRHSHTFIDKTVLENCNRFNSFNDDFSIPLVLDTVTSQHATVWSADAATDSIVVHTYVQQSKAQYMNH